MTILVGVYTGFISFSVLFFKYNLQKKIEINHNYQCIAGPIVGNLWNKSRIIMFNMSGGCGTVALEFDTTIGS